MILHLVPAGVWDVVPDGGAYSPPSLDIEGFVHCTGDDATLLRVANAFYREVPGEMVVLALDETRVGSEVRWEPPAHPDPDAPPVDDTVLFPHVFGPLPRAAVVAERRAVRTADGAYTGFEPRG